MVSTTPTMFNLYPTTNNHVSYNVISYNKQWCLLLLPCSICILQQTTMSPTRLYLTINNGVSYFNHVQFVSFNKQLFLLQCNTPLYLLQCCILKHIAISPTMFYLTTNNSIPYLMQANVLTQHMKALHTNWEWFSHRSTGLLGHIL